MAMAIFMVIEHEILPHTNMTYGKSTCLIAKWPWFPEGTPKFGSISPWIFARHPGQQRLLWCGCCVVAAGCEGG